MEKHPKITADRIRRVLDELKTQFWPDRRPLSVSAFFCAEPIPLAEALTQEYHSIEPDYPWGPQWSTAWFHLTGAYPADWAGSTVVALIDTGSEALVWADGAPLQGLDVNRADVLLATSATGGGEVDLYVEAAGNHAFGVGGLSAEKPFTFRQA